MDESERESDKLSRMNAAGLINANLEKLWTEANNFLKNGEHLKWNKTLDAIWVTLSGDTKEGDTDDEAKNAIDLKLFENGSLNPKQVGFDPISGTDKENIAKHYLALMKKSTFLRRLQNRQGKGTAYASDDDDDFD